MLLVTIELIVFVFHDFVFITISGIIGIGVVMTFSEYEGLKLVLFKGWLLQPHYHLIGRLYFGEVLVYEVAPST